MDGNRRSRSNFAGRKKSRKIVDKEIIISHHRVWNRGQFSSPTIAVGESRNFDLDIWESSLVPSRGGGNQPARRALFSRDIKDRIRWVYSRSSKFWREPNWSVRIDHISGTWQEEVAVRSRWTIVGSSLLLFPPDCWPFTIHAHTLYRLPTS